MTNPIVVGVDLAAGSDTTAFGYRTEDGRVVYASHGVEPAWYYRVARKDLQCARRRIERARVHDDPILWMMAVHWLCLAEDARALARAARARDRITRGTEAPRQQPKENGGHACAAHPARGDDKGGTENPGSSPGAANGSRRSPPSFFPLADATAILAMLRLRAVGGVS